MSNEQNKGMALSISQDEMQKMMLARAGKHDARSKIYAARIEEMAKLLVKTTAADTDARVGAIRTAIDEDDAGRPMRDLNQHVVYARDRLRAHKMSAEWLRFAAAHLALDMYVFNIDDYFFRYLVDVDHPTAMPFGRFQERGVQ